MHRSVTKRPHPRAKDPHWKGFASFARVYTSSSAPQCERRTPGGPIIRFSERQNSGDFPPKKNINGSAFDACEQVSKSVYGAILCGHCASMFSHACRHGICTRGDLYTYMSNIMLIHVCVHRWSATTGPSPCTRRALKQAETRLPEPAVLLRYVRISVHACVSFCHMFSLCEPRKSNSGCMQRSIRRCGPQCRHASRSAPGARYKRARRRSDRIHQAGGRLLIAGVLTRRL